MTESEQELQPGATEWKSQRLLETVFFAAHPGATYGAPIVSGESTVIVASEVISSGGFGYGSGPASEGAGGGGGGFSRSRPVAAITIGPSGVTVRPIVDVSTIALAAITAWGSIAWILARMAIRRARDRNGSATSPVGERAGHRRGHRNR